GIAQLAGEDNAPRPGRVFELAVPAFRFHPHPAVGIQPPEDFANLHPDTVTGWRRIGQEPTTVVGRRPQVSLAARAGAAPGSAALAIFRTESLGPESSVPSH